MKQYTYEEKLAIYEQKKHEIARTSTSHAEYERRIRELVRRLGI
jgi:proline dehydrogenase